MASPKAHLGKTFTTFTTLVLLLLLSTAALVNADTKTKRAEREAGLGAVVGHGQNYTIYSNQAKIINDKAVCTIGSAIANQAKAEAAYKSRGQSLRLPYEKERRRIQKAQLDIGNELRYKRHTGAETKHLTEKLIRLSNEKKALDKRFLEQNSRIENKYRAAIKKIGPVQISFTAIHAPSNYNEIILPLNNGKPSSTFIMGLNKVVDEFLSSCKDANLAYFYHYYQDAFRYGERDRPVISFRYNIVNSRLNLVKCNTPICRTVMYNIGNSTDPQKNPDLTLAGFIKGELKKAQMAGDYRKAFAYQASRQKGIVFKLDPYWKRYKKFDVARRIFDGDFGEHADWVEFKMLFSALAEEYSKTCKDHVVRWKTYERSSDIYDRTEYNLDGSKTIHKARKISTHKIDSRFTPQWANYGPQIIREMLQKGIFDGFALSLGFRGQMQAFLSNHACDSATTRQMTENFIRAANKRPSAQQAGIKFAGAESESDPPTKTGTPPPAFSPVAAGSGQGATVQAAVAAFGEGGLSGGDWGTPRMRKEEFSEEVDRVTDKEYDNFKDAARRAERSLEQEKPQPRAQSARMASQQAYIARRERNRKIDEETNRKIQELVNALHQKQVKSAEVFRKKIIAAKTNEEQVALQKAYKEKWRVEAEKLRQFAEKLRAEANERKKRN